MAYCTLDDILNAMDEQDVITYSNDSVTAADTPDTDVVDAIIESAGSVIDAYIANRYGAEIADPPELIVSLAVDISLYKLSSRRADAPEEFRTRYEDAVKLLIRISDGKADIPGIVRDESADTDSTVGSDDGSAAVISQVQHYTGSGTGLRGF